mgnify:CR=1 FL=1
MDIRLETLKNFFDDELLSGLCNITSYLFYDHKDLNWLGFYFYKDNKLVLGPFQGKVACTPLKLDKGVCAKAFNERRLINVEDVHSFKDHIACDSASKSELVIPLIYQDIIFGVLDIDSPIINRFSQEDEYFFNEASKYIAEYLYKSLYC